jgi:hypothetical protein
VKVYTKDPDEHLDYGWDWTQRLDDGETINDSEWILDLVDLIDTAETIDGAKAVVWLAGGTLGRRYQVTNRVTTSEDRTFDWSFLLDIRDR